MKIGVLGLFGSPNHGNEATLAAFVHNMRDRRPDVEFVCIAPRQSLIHESMGFQLIPLDPWPVGERLWRVRPHRLKMAAINLLTRVTEPRRRHEARRLLSGMSALWMPGTGLIDDFGQGPLDMPSHVARWTSAASSIGVPTMFVSVGVSTVREEASRRLFVQALSSARYLSFRDDISLANARALGCDVTERVMPDLAFSMPAQWLPRIEERNEAPKVVGIGVMGYFGWNQEGTKAAEIYGSYLERTCQLVERLVADGRVVRLLTGDSRADNATVQKVLQRCTVAAAAGRLVADQIVTFRDVLNQVAKCDVVVASRFHNVLFAIMLERPVVSLGYGDKNDALMDRFGLQALCRDIETFDPQEIGLCTERLLRGDLLQKDAMRQLLARAREDLALQYDILSKSLGRVSA